MLAEQEAEIEAAQTAEDEARKTRLKQR